MKDNILSTIGLTVTGGSAVIYEILEKLAPICANITIILGTLIGITMLLLNLRKLVKGWEEDFKKRNKEI
jgi:hypothetical protein